MTTEQKRYLEKFECYYNRMLACSSTAGRKNNFDIIYHYYMADKEFFSRYYEIDVNAPFYKDRVRKKRIIIADEEGTPQMDDKKYAGVSGLYLIGQTNFNPFTNEHFYYLKIGKSTDIRSRMKKYNTHNPCFWKADFLICRRNDIHFAESFFQRQLKDLSLAPTLSAEWFQVSREVYLSICERGFNTFYGIEEFKK